LYRLGLLERTRLDLKREILAFTRQVLEVARRRLDAGETSRTSVVVSRAEVASARRQVVDRWSGYIESVRTLGTTVGWDRPKPPHPTGDLAEPRTVPPKEKLLERAIDQDPQLAVLEARREHVRATLETAQREVWPNPLVGVGVTRNNIGTGAVTDKLRLMVGLPIPIWDRNQGDIARARARIQIVRRQIENRETDLRNQIYEQVETAEAAYRQTQVYQKDVLPAVESQFEMLREGFDLGELTLLDVMDARDRLLTVQREQLAILEEYVREVSDLEELLGRPVWEGIQK